MDPVSVSVIALFLLFGCALGTITGLVPGIHVNTLATMMLTSYPVMRDVLGPLIQEDLVPIAVCGVIMSASVVHSFLDFVPSVFIGAPDAEDALSVLPGHKLLLEGHGMTAVRAAAVGSLIGCSAAIVLAIPLQYVMLNGAAEILNGMTWYVLVAISGLLMINEYRKRTLVPGITAFILAGVLGYAVMNLPIPSSGIVGEGTLLMPLLTGLFGLPVLLESDGGHQFPEQTDDGRDPVGPVPGLKGVIMGTVAGWFPGITSTVGATVSSTVMPDRSPERFISTVASIGTVTTVLSLVTLSVSGGGRSGTVIVIGQILGESIGGFASVPFTMMLLSAAVSSVIGYVLMIKAGRVMAGAITRVDQKMLAHFVIIFLLALTVLTTGVWGLAISAMALTIGYIPVRTGCGRTMLCGCLILPCLLRFPLGFRFGKELLGIDDEPLVCPRADLPYGIVDPDREHQPAPVHLYKLRLAHDGHADRRGCAVGDVQMGPHG